MPKTFGETLKTMIKDEGVKSPFDLCHEEQKGLGTYLTYKLGGKDEGRALYINNSI